MKKAPPPTTLSTSQAAQKLGITERTVRNMIDRGSIYAFKIDPTSKSVYRIPDTEIMRLLRERRPAKT